MQYESLLMKAQETIADFLTRLVTLTNQMKSCGEVISEVMKVEKVLRSLTLNFDHIVVAIDESKNIDEMKLEELQASLEAHELRIKQRSSEKETEQALQDQASKKNWKGGNNKNDTGNGRVRGKILVKALVNKVLMMEVKR